MILVGVYIKCGKSIYEYIGVYVKYGKSVGEYIIYGNSTYNGRKQILNMERVYRSIKEYI